MKPPLIPPSFLKMIYRQAVHEDPHECCGMLTSYPQSPESITRLRPCRNVYDACHGLDPDNFPRSGKTAYFIDPAELLEIQKENRALKEKIRVLYHSHIDQGAYFSEEDERVASPEGEPAYPGVDYLVVSVVRGEVKESNLFHWDPRRRRHVL